MAHFNLDPEGDLVLRIPVGRGEEGEFMTYQVSAAKLQAVYEAQDPAQPLHEVLTNPDYTFAEPHPPEAVRLAFRIIRDPFDARIPTKLTECLLYDLLKFTRALGVTRITHPWAKKWAAAVKLSEVAAGPSTVERESVFIAWELGDRVSFDKMVTCVALKAKKTEDADVPEDLKRMDCFEDIASIRDDDRDESIMEVLAQDIHRVRLEGIRLIYNTISRDMAALSSQGRSTPTRERPCRHRVDQDWCEMTLLGSLHAQLYEHALWPPLERRPDKPAHETRSVKALRAKIRNTRELLNDLDHWVEKKKHPKCGMYLEMFSTLDARIKRLSVLSKGHFNDHFSEQGKLTGFVAVSFVEID